MGKYNKFKGFVQFTYLPYVTIIGLSLLILVAFLGFNSIKTSEQRFIWVGMAKETAHQLGTPVSSLMGWIEMLKTLDLSPKQVTGLRRCVTLDMELRKKGNQEKADATIKACEEALDTLKNIH